jgi:hypothetical protein
MRSVDPIKPLARQPRLIEHTAARDQQLIHRSSKTT